MKRKSKLIIIFVGVLVLLIGVAIPVTKNYQDGIKRTQQINKKWETKAIAKIAEVKRLKEKAKADKIMANKKIADKIVADKVEATRIANKKILAENTRLIREENTMISNKKIADKRRETASVATEQNNITTLSYTMDGKYFSKCNYTNGATLQFKVGQTLYLKGNLINGATQRVMYMNGGTIFGGGASEYIKMVSVGGDDITIIPEKYDWDSAYTFHIVVSN